MKLDPKYLAQLSVLVESGSFQLASEQLGLTQPALSRNMKALETRLGMALFKRDGRRSIPNSLGLQLARSGLSIRMAEKQATVAADQSARGLLGELRIGAPPIVAGRFLTQHLSRFMNENPKCHVELKTGLVHELRAMLESGQTDLVFGPQSLADRTEGLEFVPLIDDRVGILSRVGHKLANLKTINPSDLEQQFWLVHSRGSLLRQQTETAMISSGVKSLQVLCETDSIRSVLEIVSETDLITTMPRETTQPYLEDRLVFLNFDHPQFHRPLGAIKRKDTPRNLLEDKFLSMLKKNKLP